MGAAHTLITMKLMNTRSTETLSDRVAAEVLAELGRRGHSQAALARALSKPAMWVSDRLAGKVQISLNDLARIAEVMDLNPVDLLPAKDRVTLTFIDQSIRRVVDHVRHLRNGAPIGGRPSNRADRNGSPTRLRVAPFVPRRLAA